MAQNKTNNKIDFLNIDCDSNYFNTAEQIGIRKIQWFSDNSEAHKVSGSNVVTGLFGRKRITKDEAIYNSSLYATSSLITDPSGNKRKILAGTNDYYTSGTIDIYKNGVEITREKHWIAGLAKITAGTPGHLYESKLYGVPQVSIISPDEYSEIDVFNPVQYIKSGGDRSNFTYPIVTSDVNQLENFILNGIIEPFPIRPVIANFSINFPFEPHATRGMLQSGNEDLTFATDRVDSVFEFQPALSNAAWYLDASFRVVIGTGAGEEGTAGVFSGYQNDNKNAVSPFEDMVYPRGYPVPSYYNNDLAKVINSMSGSGTTYIDRKHKTGTCGLMYTNAPEGTDSIAYGGLLY